MEKHSLSPVLFSALIITIAIALSSLSLTACRTLTKTVTLKESHSHDSLRNRVNKYVDSIYIDRWHSERYRPYKPEFTQRCQAPLCKNVDTLLVTDSVYVEKVREVEVRDTVRIVERDSVPYPVEVPIDVPYVPPLYKNCTIGFWLLLIAIILIIAVRMAFRLGR